MAEDVHHAQVEPRLQLLDLLAEGDALPVAVAEEKVAGAGVFPVGEGAHHAYKRRDADPGADNDEARTLVAVHGERAIRAIEIDGSPGLQGADLRGEVASDLDAECHP